MRAGIERQKVGAEAFQKEYEQLVASWELHYANTSTDRKDLLKTINDKMKDIENAPNISFESKILHSAELMRLAYKSVPPSSRLGKAISQYCSRFLGVVFVNGNFRLNNEGLVDRVVKSKIPDGVLPSPILGERNRGASSAPTLGSSKDKEPKPSSLRSEPSMQQASTVGQATLRSDDSFTRLGTMFGEAQFCYGNKPGGVEPGFRAIDIDDEFFKALVIILKREKILPELLKQIESKASLKEKQIVFSSFINFVSPSLHKKDEVIRDSDPYNDVLKLCGFIKEEVNQNTALSAWMYKLDYPAKGASKNRTTAAQEGLREYIGTRLAGIFSNNNQKQEITWVSGTTGPHAMLACGWKNGLKELKEFLVGGDGPDYQGILIEDKNSVLRKSKVVPGLGRNLIFGLAIGDRDGIGKEAQNKGIADGVFYGFDYGKPYEGGGIATSLTDDFTFEDPLAWTPKEFRFVARHYMYRNYTIFFDTPLSERMFGVHVLRKMINGEDPPREVLDSYPGLAEELGRIQAQTPATKDLFERLAVLRGSCREGEPYRNLLDRMCVQLAVGNFSPYDRYFIVIKVDLIQAAMKNNMNYLELEGHLKFIDDMMAKATASNKKILEVFDKRLKLRSEEVDFLDKLEKVISPASIVSHHGEVILNHLRISPPEGRVPFQIQKLENGNFLLTTNKVDCVNSIKQKLGLSMQISQDRLSVELDPEQFKQLMRGVDHQYGLKVKDLLVKPNYPVHTLPILVSALNSVSPSPSKAKIEYKWNEGGDLSAIVTVHSKEQAALLQEALGLKQPPAVGVANELLIPEKSLASMQERITSVAMSVLPRGEGRRETVSAVSPIEQSPYPVGEKLDEPGFNATM